MPSYLDAARQEPRLAWLEVLFQKWIKGDEVKL